jgi:hypothetical protein
MMGTCRTGAAAEADDSTTIRNDLPRGKQARSEVKSF